MRRHLEMADNRAEWPGRRPLMLIEEDEHRIRRRDLQSILDAGFDVVTCSGPNGLGDPCPLVIEGRCPVGIPDVVICGLHSDWQPSVTAAWRAQGVKVTAVEAPSHPSRQAAYLGAAFLALQPGDDRDDHNGPLPPTTRGVNTESDNFTTQGAK